MSTESLRSKFYKKLNHFELIINISSNVVFLISKFLKVTFLIVNLLFKYNGGEEF